MHAKHRGAAGHAGSTLRAAGLTLFLVVVLLSTWSLPLPAAALSLRLFAHDFPKSSGKTVMDRVVADAKAPNQCLLVQLADDVPSVVIRFAYSSSVSSNIRLPLVVTTHEPTAPYAGTIDSHDIRKVMDLKVFAPEDLTFGENTKEFRERKKKKMTITLTAKQQKDGASNSNYAKYRSGAGGNDDVYEPVPGAYGVCFSLDRKALHYMPNPPAERVLVEIVDVIYGHAKIPRRPGGKRPTAQVGSWFGSSVTPKGYGRQRGAGDSLEDASSDIFKSTVRQLYKADDNADVDLLLTNNQNLVSNQQLQDQLDLVDQALRKMQRIQDLAVWQREREFDMRKTTESTFTRVWIATLILFVGITLSLNITYGFAKRTIVRRKLL